MSKFKVGDKLLYRSAIGEPYEIEVVQIGGVISNDMIWFFNSYGYKVWDVPSKFSFIPDVDAAKRTLEEAGYTITPPPETLRGKAYILRDKNHPNPKDGDGIFIRPTESLAKYGHCEVIAIVDWEEGQGLEDD